MAKNYYEITLALAGICQSASLVQQLANTGQIPNELTCITFHSLLETHPATTLAVYGDNQANLRRGLEALMAMLSNATQKTVTIDIARYALNLMILESKLFKNEAIQRELAQRIDQLQRQLQHYSLDSEIIASAIAAIYVDTISPLGARIQVTGPSTILQNQHIQDKVRALLLAGIRAAFLWRQVGGNRLQLIFTRNKLIGETKKILSQLLITE